MSYILDPSRAPIESGPVTVRSRLQRGSAPIESVLVSFDRGRSWHPADFETPDSPMPARVAGQNHSNLASTGSGRVPLTRLAAANRSTARSLERTA